MIAPNLLAGGFTFTGIFGSLMGINILSDYRLLPVLFYWLSAAGYRTEDSSAGFGLFYSTAYSIDAGRGGYQFYCAPSIGLKE